MQDTAIRDQKIETTPIIVMDDIKGLQDIAPPFGAKLSGSYMRSFAYKTMKDRLPVIVTGVVDYISRNKELIMKEYGLNSSEELKQIIGDLSQLRSEIMTNKPLTLLNVTNDEIVKKVNLWNDGIKTRFNDSGSPPTWFNTDWLFAECYLYQRITNIFALTRTLATYDPFEHQKKESFATFHHVVIVLAKNITNLIKKTDDYSQSKFQQDLIDLLKLNLWGNKCDLSITSGVVNTNETVNPIEQLKNFDENLLIDDSLSVSNLLQKSRNSSNERVIIDLVLDNAGYELFTDLCLAVFLTAHNFAQKIRFYVKSIPWFISDAMKKDFLWLIDTLKNSSDIPTRELGEKCWSYMKNGQWTIEVESFWSEPYDYSQMKHQSPELYAKLSEAKLVIIKGDLNYRKLLGDINWKYDTNFTTALREFTPTNIVSLRTMKCDLIVGFSLEKATEFFNKQEDWMTTGQYGLIQAAIN